MFKNFWCKLGCHEFELISSTKKELSNFSRKISIILGNYNNYRFEKIYKCKKCKYIEKESWTE